jgi:hypothetical protein
VSLAAHDEHAACACVSDHRPPVLELHAHHLLPLYLGGPDVPENRVWICPSTHANVHELLRPMLRDGPLTYRQAQQMQTRPVSRYAYDLAADGYARWSAASTPTS